VLLVPFSQLSEEKKKKKKRCLFLSDELKNEEGKGELSFGSASTSELGWFV